MRPWTACALAVLLAGLTTVDVAGFPNREPVADAGLDVSYAESTAPPYSAATNPQSIGTIDGTQSYDPDAADEGAEALAFLYRATPGPCPDPAAACPPPAFSDISTMPSIASTTPGTQCPAIQLKKGTDKGLATFLIPNIPSGPQKTCVYSIDMQVKDKVGGTDEDTVVVTILNDNQPPTSIPRPIEVLLGSTYGSGVSVTDLDIQASHGKVLTLRAKGLSDDKEVRSVQMRFCRPDCQAPDFQQDVPLVDKKVVAPLTSGETSEWSAPLPVDTPWLVVDQYAIELLIHDGEGGSLHVGGDSSGVYNLQVGATETGQCVPPGSSEPSPGPCLLLENVTPVGRLAPNLCFLGATTVEPQALGVGQTLRPFVEPYLPDYEVYGSPSIPEITDKSTMFWKLTYQTCAGIRDAADPSKVAVGPEIEVKFPYFLSLDTLFSGEQELKLRAYDRYGNDPTELVIPLTTDTATPQYMVRMPEVTYRGIPFDGILYVHDRIPTQATLSVDIFNRSATGKAIPFVNQTQVGDPPGPHSESFTLRPLREAVRTDIWGPHDKTVSCQYLFDLDGDGALDFWFDPRNNTSGLLVPVPGRRDTDPTDFVVDRNRNGLAEAGEPLVPGAVPGPLKNPGTCLSPFAPPILPATERARGRDLEAFLNSTSGINTQVFVFHLNRTYLGRTSYSFALQDIVFNRDAVPRYTFQYNGTNGVVYRSEQNLTGAFSTDQAYVDAGIAEFQVQPKAYLPGDPVVLNVTLVQRSPLAPGPEVPLTLHLSDPAWATFTSPPLGPGDTHKLTLGRPYDPKVFKGPLPFDRQNEAMQGYAPGLHVLRGNVTVPDVVEERGTANDTASTRFEVFLGKVVVGTLAAGDVASGDVFYVRAGERGLPAEAVTLDGEAQVVDSYSVTLDQSYGAPRYAFTYLKDGVPTDAYWDPQSRYDVANGHLCNQQADGDGTPKCRAVTVIGPAGAGEVDLDSPHLEAPVLVGVLLGLAFAARRRK